MSLRRPNYYLCQFAAQKISDSFVRGNILILGGDTGKNAAFLYETLLVPWNDPKLKIYVIDDFADKYGVQRREIFNETTKYFQNQVVVYNRDQFYYVANLPYILVIFSDPYPAPLAFGFANDLWDNLTPGGYYFFLNYNDGDSMYSLDFNSHPKAGIDRFLRYAIAESSDFGTQPYPYIRKA